MIHVQMKEQTQSRLSKSITFYKSIIAGRDKNEAYFKKGIIHNKIGIEQKTI